MPLLTGKSWIGKTILIIVIGLGFVFLTLFSGEGAPFGAPSFGHAKVEIQTADGKSIPFAMEIARTSDEKAYGLMNRHSMSANHGMLFLWDVDQIVNMWMKDTYIPLDMLFVRSDGVIVKIITDCEPLNLTPLSSDQPVRGVVELVGGDVSKIGIKNGDKVIYPALDGSITAAH